MPSNTDYVRALLPHEATWSDSPPLYCVYTGSIQGIWKDYACIPMILSTPGGHCGCTVYSWTEAIYTRASGQSFKDILLSPKGWGLLHAILLDLFGREDQFILGPYLVTLLQNICEPPPSLSKTLRYNMNSYWLQCSTARPRPALVAEPWCTETILSGVIDREVIDNMYLLNSTILDRPLNENVEIVDGVPTKLSARRAKLLNLSENDFFYDDYVQLVNRTAGFVKEVPVDDAEFSDSTMDSLL
ncbi:hypothetical protein FS749_001500 [Ceratobasidium sp. UAMH 11750]|nr:hypothetical protein FS749_001500 [Ceratobasidium sp. UAMH 11750]